MEYRPPPKGRPKGKVQTLSARKEQKRAYAQRKKARTIDIGFVKEEWTTLKTSLELKTDAELAVVLIQNYLKQQALIEERYFNIISLVH